MIAFLRGKLVAVGPDAAVIDVGGVGYRVQCSTPTLSQLGPPGREVRLHTHLVVREDGWELFGFAEEAEYELFRLLDSVNGIGPRVAIGALSAMPPSRLAALIRAGDASGLNKLPGIGRRLAERMVVELREKVGGLAGEPAADVAAPLAGLDGPAPASGAAADALEALLALGTERLEAQRAVARAAAEEPDATPAVLLRLALRLLAGAEPARQG